MTTKQKQQPLAHPHQPVLAGVFKGDLVNDEIVDSFCCAQLVFGPLPSFRGLPYIAHEDLFSPRRAKFTAPHVVHKVGIGARGVGVFRFRSNNGADERQGGTGLHRSELDSFWLQILGGNDDKNVEAKEDKDKR